MPNFYHITDKETAKEILKSQTIHTQNGKNKTQTYDERTGVFLCKRRDIPYWRQLLDKHTVIQIPDTNINQSRDVFTKYKYSLYNEYLSKIPITSKHMTIKTFGKPNNKINRELCAGYIDMINLNLRHILYFEHNNPYKKTETDVIQTIQSILYITEKLHYEKLSKTDWNEIKHDVIDSCCCALSDFYNNTNTRIYEQLQNQDNSDYGRAKQALYKFITIQLKPVLTADTGGWTFEGPNRYQ